MTEALTGSHFIGKDYTDPYMKILALETSIEELKQKFLVEGEKAVHVTHKHFLAFSRVIFWPTVAAIVFLSIFLLAATQGWWDSLFFIIFFFVGLIIYVFFFIAGYVQWKYNFVIVTTQKVILVEQRSLFYHQIHPLHFETIRNVRVESQYGGFFQCGILHISLAVPERGGTSIELPIPYLSKPENIAAVIENGLVLNKEPLKEKDEAQKKESMQEPAITAENPQPELLLEEQK
jgi:hypothetical protein